MGKDNINATTNWRPNLDLGPRGYRWPWRSARFLTFTTIQVGFLVAMWWAVLTPPETRTATVTSTTPTSCTESICEYPMALTLNTNETIDVVGTFPRTLKAGSSEYETAITIGEKAKFRNVDGEWKQRMNIPPPFILYNHDSNNDTALCSFHFRRL